MTTIAGDEMNYTKCQVCGSLYNGWHICQGYLSREFYIASTGEIIDKLSKIEELLLKILIELQIKR